MSGLFGSSKQTSTSDQSFNKTQEVSGERSKRQSGLFKEMLDQLMGTISQGPQIMRSDRDAMYGSINKAYNAAAGQVEGGLTGRGFGESGKLGNALKNLDISRAGDFMTGEQGLQSQAQQRYAQMIGLAWPYLAPDLTTTTSSGTATGTQTQPGPSVFDRLLGYGSQAAGIAALFGI